MPRSPFSNLTPLTLAEQIGAKRAYLDDLYYERAGKPIDSTERAEVQKTIDSTRRELWRLVVAIRKENHEPTRREIAESVSQLRADHLMMSPMRSTIDGSAISIRSEEDDE